MLEAEMPISRMPRFPDYLAALRHRKRQIAGVAVALGLLVALLSYLVGWRAATYEGTSDVLIESSDGTEPNPATEARILASVPVAERVKEGLDGDLSAKALLERTTVTQVPESSVLTVRSEAGDPRTAARIANLFVREFLVISADHDRKRLKAQLDSLRDQISFTEKRLDHVLGQKDSPRAQRSLLSQKVEELRSEANLVGEQLQTDLRPGRVVAPAVPELEPVSRSMSPAVLGGAAAVTGLLFMIAFILLQEHFSDRVRRRSDITQILKAPVLAIVPGSSQTHDDALRLLANDLHQEMQRTETRALLFAPLPAQVAATRLISHVAAHLSEADRKVVVVKPADGSRSPADRTQGEPVPPSAEKDGNEGVVYFPRRISPPAAEKLVTELKAEWDTVLIDGPETMSADASSLAGSVDGVVLVVGTAPLSQTLLARAGEQIARSETPLLGAVVLSSSIGIPLGGN